MKFNRGLLSDLGVGIFVFIIALLVTAQPSWELQSNRYLPFFNLQAKAFRQGQVALPVDSDWEHDVIPFHEKKYLAFPPLNAFLMLPSFAIFKIDMPERVFTLTLFALYVLVIIRFVRRFTSPLKPLDRGLWILFFSLGTVFLNCTAVGTAWFSAALSGSLFLAAGLLCFVEARKTQQSFVALAIISVAALSRYHLILITPILILIASKKDWRKLLILSLPCIVFLCIVGWWNWVRFGSPFQLKYQLHGYGAIFGENISKYGFTHWRYIFLHIYHGLISSPELTMTFPFFKSNANGNGIFALSPLFLFAVFRNRSDSASIRMAWLMIGILVIPIFLHFSTGWSQFGYRYAMDFLPLLAFILIQSKFKITSPLSLVLIAISLWFNVLGTWVSIQG